MKRFLLSFGLVTAVFLGAWTLSSAQFVAPQPFYKSGLAWIMNKSTETLGNASNRIAEIWATSINAGSVTVSGASSADLDLSGFKILNAGTITGTNFVATSTTAASSFKNASTTNFSNIGIAYFGSTSTTTISNTGVVIPGTLSVTGLTTLGSASSTLFSNVGTAYFGGTATTTLASNGTLAAGGSAHGAAFLDTDGATITVDWSKANTHEVVLGAAGRTLAFSNVSTGTSIKLWVWQDGTGSRTITTYPAGIHWAGGTAPTLTTTAGKFDILVFTTSTSTTQFTGAASLNY